MLRPEESREEGGSPDPAGAVGGALAEFEFRGDFGFEIIADGAKEINPPGP